MPISPEHIKNAERAQALYLDGQKAVEAAADWGFAVRQARRSAAAALRASALLTDLPRALQENGSHLLVLRQVLAPPVSQDQFKLICSAYSKTAENKGRPISAASAAIISEVISQRLDKGVAGWHHRGSRPTRRELETFLRISATLIGLQKIATARRSRLAFDQEYAVVDMLLNDGWTQLPSRLIDERASVPPRHFMYKTRFATATTSPQEVDIACGLNGTQVLALECKVTNDQTNSVKRINDVLKKAAAWERKWGTFFYTAALLQGGIAPKDVQRLTDAGINAFWSHDIAAFRDWLSGRV